MNIRLTPRNQPNRTDMYSSVVHVEADGRMLTLVVGRAGVYEVGHAVPLLLVAEITVDHEGGIE